MLSVYLISCINSFVNFFVEKNSINILNNNNNMSATTATPSNGDSTDESSDGSECLATALFVNFEDPL